MGQAIEPPEFDVRLLGRSDLLQMFECEEAAWPPDVRASDEQLRDRLETFPDGCFGAWANQRLIGMATCQIVQFDPSAGPVSWSALCADGWIRKTHQDTGNCVHCVSTGVRPDFRGQGVGTALATRRLALGQRKGLEFALTDTRLPGLAKFLADSPSKTAEDYLEKILSGSMAEPVVNMCLHLGFQPLGLVASSMQSDPESAQYGLAMIYRYPAQAS